MKLGEITGLTFQEVRNWFRNARLRYKEPLTATCDIRYATTSRNVFVCA